MIFRLVILNGPRQGERITVPIEPLVVGRGPDCGLRLDDPEVAERHAVIEHFQGGLLIHDLGSMNRILVNKRETARSILKHGDEIEIGRTRLLVQAFVQAEVKSRPPEIIGETAGERGTRAAVTLMVVLLAALAVVWMVRARRSPATTPSAAPSAAATTAAPPIVVELPPPTSAPPAGPVMVVVTSAVPDEATVEEIRRLRAELALLQSSFRAMATQAAATVESARHPPPTPPPSVTTTAAPPTRAEVAARTIARAKAEAAAGRWETADRMLAELQRQDPDLLVAYELRATWFEQRGQIEAALAQWAEMYQRAADRPEAARAAEEWTRLSLEQRRAVAARAGRVTIEQISVQRFPESQDYDDMRLVRIVLRSAAPRPPPPDTLRVEVVMFDESEDGRTIMLTRAMPAQVRAWIGEAWSADGTLNASAAYVVPAGFRRRSATHFHGCIVRVFCENRLEDEAARPVDLLIRAPAQARRSP